MRRCEGQHLLVCSLLYCCSAASVHRVARGARIVLCPTFASSQQAANLLLSLIVACGMPAVVWSTVNEFSPSQFRLLSNQSIWQRSQGRAAEFNAKAELSRCPAAPKEGWAQAVKSTLSISRTLP